MKHVLHSSAAIPLGCIAVILAACSRRAPSATEGRSLYLENGCVSCHGPLGKGDGPLAAALAPKPTDLSDPSLFKRGSGETAIARTLADGVMNPEMSMPRMRETHHELSMPKFDHLTEAERRSIALYVISLHTGGSQP